MRLRREDLRSLDVPAFEVLAEAHSDERKLLCFMHTEHFTEERQKSRKKVSEIEEQWKPVDLLPCYCSFGR
ncbi:hypothetical protein SRHO_G00152450 [Serrasalmus rhombeus]